MLAHGFGHTSPMSDSVTAADAIRAASGSNGQGQGQQPKGLVGDLAALVVGGLERALDQLVADAVKDPLPVRTPAEAVEHVTRHGGAGPLGPAAALLGWISGRWGARVLRIGRRFSLPLRTILAVLPPLAIAVRRGLFELRVLASLAVNRLNDDGIPVDTRRVQRLVINAYLWSDRPVPFEETRPTAVARLAWVWASRALSAEGDASRVERAAAALERAQLGDRA